MIRKSILLILIIIMVCSVLPASAVQTELPFGRMMYVHEWGNQLSSQAAITTTLNGLEYQNVDAAMIFMGSEYFETQRDPATFNDPRVAWDMLNWTIAQAHARDMQVHVWIFANKVNSPARAEYTYFGNDHRLMTREGAYQDLATWYREDIAYPTCKAYHIDLLTWIASTYDTLDGIHLEEPYYTYDPSYTPIIRERVIARTGYDPKYQTVSAGDAAVIEEQRIALYEFHRDLQISIEANKANPDLLLSGNGHPQNSYGCSFDIVNISDNGQWDWYAGQIYRDDVDLWRGKVAQLDAACDDILHIPVIGISYDIIYPTANPAIFQEVAATPEFSSSAEGFFRYGLSNFVVSGTVVADWLSDNPSNYIPSDEESPPPATNPIGNFDNNMKKTTPTGVFNDVYFVDSGTLSAGTAYRSLLFFNLSDYPSDTMITSAYLEPLWWHNSSVRDLTTNVEVYQPTKEWITYYATWNRYTEDTSWDNPGGDYNDSTNTPQGTVPWGNVTIPLTGFDNQYHPIDVTDLVQSYINESKPNYGFLIKAEDEVATNYIAFRGFDWSNASEIPKLTIDVADSPPNITSWGNNDTDDQTLAISIDTDEVVNFNMTANQTIVTWSWYVDTINQNVDADEINLSFVSSGEKIVEGYGSNQNGSTQTITWTVTVDYSPPMDEFEPPSPINIAHIETRYTQNITWEAGSGNVSDLFHVQINQETMVETTDAHYIIETDMSGTINVSVYSYNNSGQVQSTPTNMSIVLPWLTMDTMYYSSLDSIINRVGVYGTTYPSITPGTDDVYLPEVVVT